MYAVSRSGLARNWSRCFALSTASVRILNPVRARRTSMGLLEQCQDVQRRVREYQQLRTASDEAEGYATRLKALRTATEALGPLMETRRTLADRGIHLQVPSATAAGIATRLTQVR